MQKNEISVFASNTLAGDIIRSDMEEDTFLFTYERECKSNFAVSLSMPVARAPYDSMGTIHPIFEMNLPEGALREKLERMFSKVIPNFDALSLLQIVGKSQIGRLRYAQTGNELEEVPTQSVSNLLSYTGAEDLFHDLLGRFAEYSGISGMQPKVLIRDDNGQPLNRLKHRGATHIVKSFDSREYPELAANEFFCMAASRYAGLPTAKVLLSENRKMLVVERFDLFNQTYLGFEDFCVLSGMRSSGRYESSYEKLAERIKLFVSPEHQADSMSHYFGAVVLACIIRNGDAHLKNFGVLYSHPDSDVRLAPIYDMLSTKPYQPHDVLALELNGSKQYPSYQKLIQFGRQACGLSKASVNSIFDRVIQGVSKSILDMNAFTQSHPDFEKPMEHFCKVFQDGIESMNL
ncbi:type II toxin-antitoxin system HipA family toxin [Polynucleobacter rarus]|uniref:type II toxin-antitoxin system HipA family toxin n=1 Tax=Polynucleobacter rarus TaxID=556055 RepID=UPI00131F1185|nr:type II toxin-antitoxin system HipA family toxin [Polynucleobacter rarus]